MLTDRNTQQVGAADGGRGQDRQREGARWDLLRVARRPPPEGLQAVMTTLHVAQAKGPQASLEPFASLAGGSDLAGLEL